MVKRAGYVGATKVIEASTGATGAISVPPLQALVVQVVDATTGGGSTGTFDVAGSLDGANWVNISTGNAISGNTVLALPSTNTALPAFTNIQITVAADPAVSVYVAGR